MVGRLPSVIQCAKRLRFHPVDVLPRKPCLPPLPPCLGVSLLNAPLDVAKAPLPRGWQSGGELEANAEI